MSFSPETWPHSATLKRVNCATGAHVPFWKHVPHWRSAEQPWFFAW